jgi:hypothetical protein
MYKVSMDLKAKFLKIYSNLPLGVREEIVTVIDGEDLSWKAAKLEVEQGTEKGKRILEQLRKLQILI